MGKSKVNRYQLNFSERQREKIQGGLELLNLFGMVGSFERLAREMMQSHKTPYDFLENLLQMEMNTKEQNRLERWIQLARFPWLKTIHNFDFSFQPSIDKQQILELSSCRFIDEAENIIFFGPPGVGKTHLAVALGYEAIKNGYEVRFITLCQIIETLEKIANAGGTGETRRRFFNSLVRPKLLILDEMDFYNLDEDSSNFLFRLLQQRYEKGSVIFTSNKTFSQWENVFGNKVRAAAIIDRIVHKGYIINIEGESYRAKGVK